MISLSARYAIKAVMHLARSDGWVGSEELARVTGIPNGYLMKILQRLVIANILQSQRGKNGGFRLRSIPSAITLWDIIKAIERPPTDHICRTCSNCQGCSADRVLTEIEAEMGRLLQVNDIGTMVEGCRTHTAILSPTSIILPHAKNIDMSSQPNR